MEMDPLIIIPNELFGEWGFFVSHSHNFGFHGFPGLTLREGTLMPRTLTLTPKKLAYPVT